MMAGLTANEAWSGTLHPGSVRTAQLEPGDLCIDRSIADFGSIRVLSGSAKVGYEGHSDLIPGRAVVGVTAGRSTDARWFGERLEPADIIHTNTSMDLTTHGPSELYYVAIEADKLEANNARHVYRNAGHAERLRRYLNAAMAGLRAGIDGKFIRESEGTLLSLLLGCLDEDGASRAHTVLNRRVAAVRTCEAYVREHIDENPSLSDLCAVSGLRARSLINAFQAVIGMSPMSYLRIQRLNEVRKALLNLDPSETRVIQVAATWGFWHMGHFAMSYRDLFGELPSETLSRQPRRVYEYGVSAYQTAGS